MKLIPPEGTRVSRRVARACARVSLQIEISNMFMFNSRTRGFTLQTITNYNYIYNMLHDP